jgi:hypothetical protein
MPDRTAQAAVLGVALAGGVAVAVAPEAWDWSDTTVGLTLLAVLAGYYRRSWSPVGMRSSCRPWQSRLWEGSAQLWR